MANYDLNLCLVLFQPFKVSAFEKRLVKEIELREGKYQPPMPASDTEAFEESVPLMQCKPPKFEQKLSNFQLMEGSDATFVCKVSGNPKPKVRVFTYIYIALFPALTAQRRFPS